MRKGRNGMGFGLQRGRSMAPRGTEDARTRVVNLNLEEEVQGSSDVL